MNALLELQFLYGELYTRNISAARWRNHRQIAAEFTRLAAVEEKPDVILCSYPTIELSAAAVLFGEQHGIPVLLDIRDLWPDEMAARLPRFLRSLAPLLLWPMYRDARLALKRATGMVAISRRYLAWGLEHAQRAGNDADAVFTHGYPSQQLSNQADVQNVLTELGLDASQRVFWFVGTFVGSIDLATVIEAARILDDQNVVFVLTGSGEKDAEWRAQAHGLRNVRFTGWVDKDRLQALASIAWVGLAAYKAGALMSLTNKLFEYMAHGLPILVSLPGEARAVVESERCGMFYEPGSATALATAVRAMCADSSLRDAMAANARRAFEARYSATAVYDGLASHLEVVAADEAGRRR
ncbi:glycosyltransferase involved in cell wall biosynthesis [Povalibacter uvarum]|uniref:Glycosyltransferase involved in cell wall biosynthesis n=1 Tax=Povalibacter uvarum TaxID=732238 RepID=A0A841HFR2_9GAMM|nr:glycosyltransferase involved in cell wall biosynthesis [Povalibacter uvarum]